MKKKWKLNVLNPLLISIVLVIGFLQIFKIDYESYNNSAKYLSYLLTPATVSLAIPLYQQIELLKSNAAAICMGILAGVLTSLGLILALAILFHLSYEEYVTLLPKSITTAIGMGVSEELGVYSDHNGGDHHYRSAWKYDRGTGMQNIPDQVCRVEGHCHRNSRPCDRNGKSYGDGRDRGGDEQPRNCGQRIVHCCRGSSICRILK